MSLSDDQVRRIARLARIEIRPEESAAVIDRLLRYSTTVNIRGAYSSAVDPILTRAFATMRVKSTKPQRVTICAPS